ncbi:1-deoxy-D-xylulose-5-phosphate synthase, partial [Bacillus cereus]|nr:1-deoxy-D-xylulose-5-phosphate synthase [Bacillus cereus]
KPFLAIYSTFIQRAYNQGVHDIGRQNLNVFNGIDRSGLVGADGETHQGVFDSSFLRNLPNMVLMMPKDDNEEQHLVYTEMQYEDGPIALRCARGNGLGDHMDEELKAIPIGRWETIKEGNQAAILTIGTTIPKEMEAGE